ncbi:MAG: hypothetical protein LKM45_05715 [Wolbachia endosymbiont of Alcedoecus sp.]|nr:hypothetical protein [Wolbachia endosymbiont of Alcedoecus sp.]
MKGADGKYALVTDKNKELEELGLEEQDDEINTYLGKLSSVTPAGQGPKRNK